MSRNPDGYQGSMKYVLAIKHESGNSHDIYAIAIMKRLELCICY